MPAFLNCSCRSAVQCKLRPPPFLASSAQCSLVQLSSSQPAPGCSQREKLYNFRSIEGRHYSTVQCTVLQLQPVAGGRGGPWNKCFSFRKGSIHIWRQMIFGYFWLTFLLKYEFCKKSLRKNETLTSWTLLAHFFSRSVLIWKKSEPKVFNWSEFHFF